MAGVVVMLAVAGLLEGFGRQLINRDAAALCRGGFHRAVWGVYFYRRRSRAMSAAGAKMSAK